MTSLIKHSKSIFQKHPRHGVSLFRFYLLRTFYVLIVLMLGIEVWTKIFTQDGAWEPLPAVAYSFWAAFSALALLGVIHPMRMIPLLLVQFSYKLIWLIIVAYPLWKVNQLTSSPAMGLTEANAIGIVIDLLVIPWSYVLNTYIKVK